MLGKTRRIALKVGEAVEVTEMADTDDCARELMVLIKWQGEKLAVPLDQLETSTQSNKLTRQFRRLQRATKLLASALK